MSFKLTYILDEAGWANARIDDVGTTGDITVSYLNDPLLELAEAALAFAKGAESAQVVFMAEPGETQLLLSRAGDKLNYQVRWYEDWASWKMHPVDDFKTVLSGTTTVPHFVREIRQQLQLLLDTHGLEGYKAKWLDSDFPIAMLHELNSLVVQTTINPSNS